jgi:transposase
VYWNEKPIKIPDHDRVVAIDPGVRKFATTYSPEGKVEIIGTNTQAIIPPHVNRVSRRKQLADQGYKVYQSSKQSLNQLWAVSWSLSYLTCNDPIYSTVSGYKIVTKV